MLTKFDWLRRSRTGSELLITLKYFAAKPNRNSEEYELGAPITALHGPCERCYSIRLFRPRKRNRTPKKFRALFRFRVQDFLH